MATNEDRKNSATSNNTDSIRKDRGNNAKAITIKEMTPIILLYR